jgi:16S rRNA (uracil1498-N3)-methyltransferase
MALPFFYFEDIQPSSETIYLGEETSRHVVQVLRMKVDEEIQLTDGKGNLYTAAIVDDHRKKCAVKIVSQVKVSRPTASKTIAISLVKNNTRFEWFLEKATEIGVTQIIPLLCSRTEKQHFRLDRMKGILVSAMLQSQQSWLPELQEPQKFSSFVGKCAIQQRFIAHCEEASERLPLNKALEAGETSLVLIGPEGDFTLEEIIAALTNDFVAVSLGNTRLRTETAGMVAAVMLCAL